jgi:D-3-phosphoglycerate dehydrogenase / 2-oxoglutarate reductase
MYRVAVTDYTFPEFSRYREELAGIPIELLVPDEPSPAAFVEIARDADALIHEHLFLTGDIIRCLRRCRIIAHHGKGFDNIDIAAATERGILVANVLGASQDEVVEHALALMLAVARRIPAYQAAVRRGRWHVAVGEPLFRLHGKTLGLVGFGDLARKLATKARGLGLEPIAYARRPSPAVAEQYGVRFVDLPTLFSAADVVSIHLPLTSETRGLVEGALLGRMKPTAILINISRGAIVDEAALVRLLGRGGILGAGLDVLSDEPPADDNPLLHLDNVVVTPHCAWYSEEARDDVERRTAREVARVLGGGWPVSLVNPEATDRFVAKWLGEGR